MTCLITQPPISFYCISFSTIKFSSKERNISRHFVPVYNKRTAILSSRVRYLVVGMFMIKSRNFVTIVWSCEKWQVISWPAGWFHPPPPCLLGLSSFPLLKVVIYIDIMFFQTFCAVNLLKKTHNLDFLESQ